MISDNAAIYSGRGAHRLDAWGALVAMVLRSARLRSYGEDRSIGVRRPIPEWPMAADVVFQVKCARTLTHLQNINLWATVARVESKRTVIYSPGQSLCSRSIGPRSVEEVHMKLIAIRQGRCPSAFWKHTCYVMSLSILTVLTSAWVYLD